MTIADLFDTYRKHVIPPGAGRVQVYESRRAFYAGSLAIMTELIAATEVSDDEGATRLDGLYQECLAFGAAGGQVTPPPPDVHYTVEDPLEMQATLKDIGGRINDRLPAGWGFLLMLFEFGPNGSLFYLSNADRADMIKALHEFIRRQTQ